MTFFFPSPSRRPLLVFADKSFHCAFECKRRVKAVLTSALRLRVQSWLRPAIPPARHRGAGNHFPLTSASLSAPDPIKLVIRTTSEHVRTTSDKTRLSHLRTASEPHPKQWQKLREKWFLARRGARWEFLLKCSGSAPVLWEIGRHSLGHPLFP